LCGSNLKPDGYSFRLFLAVSIVVEAAVPTLANRIPFSATTG
jgi:hypothetical protein